MKSISQQISQLADRMFHKKTWGLWVFPVGLIVVQLIDVPVEKTPILLAIATVHLLLVTMIANIESSFSDTFREHAHKALAIAGEWKQRSEEYKDIAETATSLNAKILAKTSFDEIPENKNEN